MSRSLEPAALAGLPAEVRRPAYDFEAVRTGIVHLGAGAFHRAHQAVYTDDLLGAIGGDWGITAVSMRNPAVADGLRQQQGLYSLSEFDVEGRPDRRIIAAIREALVLAQAPQAVAAAIARTETHVVSLTVTEKAYYRQAGGHGLDRSQPQVQADLAAQWPEHTAIGALVAGLDCRRQAQAGPVTVLCCDNLADNGAIVRRLCSDFAQQWKPGLEEWIDANVSFPSTMVDRITPATTPEVLAETAVALGCEDAIPVIGEAFRQWVIEDAFAGPRPPWDQVGAQFVTDVRPFEEMKLRMLNASHSGLAYLGLLAGFAHVHEALAEPAFRRFIERTMAQELAPTVRGVSSAELERYRAALLQRFASPRPAHRLAQIAEDGSQKIPIRVLNPLRERRAAAAACDGLILIAAAWLKFVQAKSSGLISGELRDPMAEELLDGNAADKPSHFAQRLESVFGLTLLQDPVFLEGLDRWGNRLDSLPVPRVLEEAVARGDQGSAR